MSLLSTASHHFAKKRSLKDEKLAYQSHGKFAEQAASSATRLLSPIQGLLSWVKQKGSTLLSYTHQAFTDFFIQKVNFSSIKGDHLSEKENLNFSQYLNYQQACSAAFAVERYPALQQQNDASFNRPTFNQVTAQFDLDATLVLSHYVIQRFFSEKSVKTKDLRGKKAENSKFFQGTKLPKTDQIRTRATYKNFNLSQIH